MYQDVLSKLGSERTANVRSEPSFVRSEPSFVRSEPSFVRSEPSFFSFDIRYVYNRGFLIIFLYCKQCVAHYGINVSMF